MSQTILSINAGSSSVKVSIYSLPQQQHGIKQAEPEELAQISISGLTAPPAALSYTRLGQKIKSSEQLDSISGPKDAYNHILSTLINDSDLHCLNQASDITYAAHRIVHGGTYTHPVRIDKDTYHHLETLSALAPLHNAGALDIVRAVHAACPSATNVAFFDSAFHATIPRQSRTYAIDPEIAQRNHLRKYGFHGLSYAFITRALASQLRKPPAETNLIACHLGSGCSVTAIRHGHSLDTSMGLTPLSGLPGATRSGDVDASLIFHFTNHAGDLAPKATKDMHLTTAEQILNQESGWKSLAGTTDFGEITRKAGDGDEGCKLAFDLLVDRLVGYIGAYFVKLGGEVDGLVFAGGIGEKGAQLRAAVVERVGFLGFGLDAEKNEGLNGERVVESVGSQGAKHAVWVVQTDEQGEMARQLGEWIGQEGKGG